jgi:hypothetical protein
VGRGTRPTNRRMRNLALTYEKLPLLDGQLELSDDRQSCDLFLATLLDHASAEHVERVTFCPAEAERCLRVVIGRDEYEMVPLPREAGAIYLRFIQQMLLGKFSYLIFIRLSRRPFERENCGPLLVDVGGRRSKWSVNCTHKSVCFVRVQ